MRRHVLSHLESLDTDTRELVQAAARRSGLSPEEWAAAVLAEHGGKSGQAAKPPRRRAGDDLDGIIARLSKPALKRSAGDELAKTAIALESMASWIEHAEERLNESARASADHQDRVASALAQALSALKDRLDTIERHVGSERPNPARIEFPVQDAIKALAPLSETLVGLRTDMSRLAERLEQPVTPAWTPAVEEIRTEIDRLRSAMGGLATREEIAVLGQAMRQVSEELEQGRSAKELLTLAKSVAAVYRQVQTLSEDLAEGVHRRIGAEIELIKGRIDRIAESGADRSVVESLSRQIAEMRQDLACRAEPQQIERLSAEVGALSGQIAELRAHQVGRSDFAALKDSLENVCEALSRTVAIQEASTVPVQLQDLGRRLDVLASRPEPANLDPITAQLALLTEKMAAVTDSRLEQTETLTAMVGRLSAQVQTVADNTPSQEPLLKRFDRLEDEVRQVGRQADSSKVELMLRSINEKLDQRPAPEAAFDALEQRIMSLADQFARTPAEPFRKIFDDVSSHLKKLQDETSIIAERAARAALKDAQSSSAPAAGDLDALKQAFVELKALQTRSDKKTQETLRAVHDALESLVSRFPMRGPVAKPVGAPASSLSPTAPSGDMPSADRLEAAVRRLHAAALSQIEDISAASPAPPPAAAPEKPRADLPETPRSIAAAFSPQESDPGNVRASFIAAARRAAQTSAPERPLSGDPAPAKEAAPATDDSGAGQEPEQGALAAPSLIERLRRTFDAHRRPLLFGLALLILAAGAAQILSGDGSQDTASAPVPVAQVVEAQAPAQDRGGASPVSAPASQDEARIFAASSLADIPFTPSKTFIVEPSTLREIPPLVPVSLREAALSGDAAAIYEIAARIAEGRGLPPDPALAAHFYERAAQAGFAPAQERFAMLLEKGIGLPRDVKLAATWYERAAQGGNVRAMHNLATLLASGVNGKVDYESALRWYSEAAEAGLRDSQFNLGVLFARGIGTRPDLAQAFKWFAIAAAQSDAEAAKKRDEIAAKLSPADLAAAKEVVERWRPRAIDPSANETVAPVAAGRTATLDKVAGNKS